MRARIIRVKAQMLDFNYFFGVNLGERLFSMTDNLSRTLQQTRRSAVQGQRLAELTKQTIQKMRTDDDFEDFFCLVKKKADSLQTEISEPSLPRRRKAPKCFEIGGGDPYFPSTESEHYKVQYFEAIDLAVSAIDGRFNQPGFKGYKTMEQLLVKSLLHSDFLKVAEEYDYIKENYSQDLKAYLLK